MRTKYSLFGSIALCLFLSVEAQATTLDDIGFNDLSLELGVALPDGASIAVTQVEAPASGACAPNMGLADFSSITFIDNTTAFCTGISGHATSVAQKFYGSVSSSSTAIGDVDLFEAVDWVFAGFLNSGAPGLITNSIDISTTRLVNHSWAAPTTGGDGEILRRIDFLVEVDEFIQVVGVSTNTVVNMIPSNSFNAIVAGLSAGTGTTGTAGIDSTYVIERAKPDIVSPEGTGSASAPRISSAAVLLMDHGHTNPLLSNGSITTANGTIYNAELSETIKALLMAGADRETIGNTNAVDITDYRYRDETDGTPDYQTSNGLDTRFGAGQVNIYNSYHMLAAGEQDSEEDGGSTFANAGFDYDPSFGGTSDDATATYSFTTSAISGQKIKAALVWNLDVLTTSTDNFYDLDLQLFDVTGGEEVVISNSAIDNTENLWLDLLSNRSYELRVIKGTGQADFDWDYALAWQIVVPGVTVVETDSSTVTAEDGSTDTFTLVLDSPPTDDVVITLTSSNLDEATVLPASVTFTSANWSTLQTATVTGVNDLVDDGDINYNINFAVSSTADANYNGMAVAGVAASNTDDDATFSFVDQSDVALDTVITSNTVVITGLLGSTAISITGGEYSIDSGTYTSAGSISNGNAVTLRTTSSTTGLTAVNAVLTIGDVNDTFTVTTEVDTDSDGVGDTLDTDDDNDTLTDIEEGVLGTNPLLVDSDTDGDNDNVDNCPVDANADQLDTDNDDAGNVCDTDDDNDTLTDIEEGALGTDPLLVDSDTDGDNDNVDNCPVDANADQLDTDNDGAGNVCDADDDNDGLSDTTEATLGTDPLLVDTDGDSVSDNTDAFPTNIAASVDADNDGLPDAWNASCDVTCQTNSGLTLDTTSSTATSGGGGGGSLGLMWLALPFLITVSRRRVLH